LVHKFNGQRSFGVLSAFNDHAQNDFVGVLNGIALSIQIVCGNLMQEFAWCYFPKEKFRGILSGLLMELKNGKVKLA
jgi:hypothetical protein